MQPLALAFCLFLSSYRGVTIDRESNEVSRRDLSGRLLWSVRLDGKNTGIRFPQYQCDTERVYVSHDDGVTALDMKTGKVVWNTKGPSDCMLLSGDLLLALSKGNGWRKPLTTNGRWLTARATKTGAEVFRIRLSEEDTRAKPIQEITGLFLVETIDDRSERPSHLLFDRQGRVHHRFDHEVVDGRIQGTERLFLTNREVVCLSPEGKTLWEAPFEEGTEGGGGFVSLPGGGLVAFLYCPDSDSGVQVIRLDACKGTVVWRASCAGLGVSHSRYSHRASVTLDEGQVKVNSKGSAGTFEEYLDLGTGRRLKRN